MDFVAFVRFSLTFITVSGTLSGPGLDLHVNFDHIWRTRSLGNELRNKGNLCLPAERRMLGASTIGGTTMVTVVANNLAMTALGPAISEVYSDPIDLGGNDRATVMWSIHYLWAYDAGGGGATGTAGYQAQVSNDGVYWVDVGALADTASAATGSTPRADTAAVNGQFIRFKITLTASSGDLAGAAVDLHVLFDHV